MRCSCPAPSRARATRRRCCASRAPEGSFRRELAHAGTRLDPQRPRPSTELCLAVEDRGARLVLAPVAADAPADERARFADVHPSVDVRGKFREQHHAIVGSDGVVARTVEGGRHEFGSHLAITGIERGVGYPGRGHYTALGDRPGEDAQAIAAPPLRAAHETAREAVIAETRVAA